jgi:hypothetical protein
MPAWIPGSYMIRDYARNVVSIRAESDGLDVPLEKTDKSTWRAAPVSRPLTIVAEIYAYADSRARIDASYMLMERLPGRALSDAPHVSARFYDRVLDTFSEEERKTFLSLLQKFTGNLTRVREEELLK